MLIEPWWGTHRGCDRPQPLQLKTPAAKSCAPDCHAPSMSLNVVRDRTQLLVQISEVAGQQIETEG